MTTTTRKQTAGKARASALNSDLTPLYALAGLTDLIAGRLRIKITETSVTAGKRLAELKEYNAQLERQARDGAGELVKLVNTLPAHYAELAGRGKLAVDAAVGTARKAPARKAPAKKAG